jgi:TRAP-type mannitol/chloroaromatic compound transport system substrate-binding protein
MQIFSANAQSVTWKVQSNKPADGILFSFEKHLAKDITKLTKNTLIFDLRSGNDPVGVREAFNALRLGKIDAMFMSPQYWGGADPVFPIMGDLVAAWDSPEQYFHWLNDKGGIKHLEAAYLRFGLKLVGYVVAPTESLVSKVAIADINDIQGQVMRTPPGMISDFFQLLGARTRNLTASKVTQALTDGKITIADLSHISMNSELGLYKQAKHTNYPGFHSAPLYDFVVNQKAWDALTAEQQDVVSDALLHWRVISYKANQEGVNQILASLKQQGVTIHRWDKLEIKKARTIAIAVWDKYAAKSDHAKALITELKQWLKVIGNIN